MNESEDIAVGTTPDAQSLVDFTGRHYNTIAEFKDAFSHFCFDNRLAYSVKDSRPDRFEAVCPGASSTVLGESDVPVPLPEISCPFHVRAISVISAMVL